MAKDKSKKSTTVVDDDFAKPSDAPAGGDAWKFESPDNKGKLFLITPLRVTDEKAYGKAGERGERQEIVHADIVELNEKKPEKSIEHRDVWIFGGWTKGATRGYIPEPGQRARLVVARLEQDASKSQGDRPAWVLEDADADDLAVARAYRASVDPLTAAVAPSDAGKKGKSKAEPEPSKKGKGGGKKAEPEPAAKSGKGKKK